MPAKPWGVTALHRAEAAALARFPTMADTFTTETWDSSWRFVRFLGQVWIDAFAGYWVNLPTKAHQRGGVAVAYSSSRTVFEPIGLLTAAMHRRTGTEWERVFGYAADRLARHLADWAPQPHRELTAEERVLFTAILAAVGSPALLAQLAAAHVSPAGDRIRRLHLPSEVPVADFPDGRLPMHATYDEPGTEIPADVQLTVRDGRLTHAELVWYVGDPPRWPPADRVRIVATPLDRR